MDAAAFILPGCVVASAVATRVALAWLRHKQILDHPNERSSHALPTPRGGGLGVTPVLAAALLLLGQPALAAGALALMAVSWLDDRRGLPPLPRFLAQAGVIAVLLALLPADMLVFHGLLPLWADRVLAGLGWLWFVNLYNFMDGIDGISGVETVNIGLGLAVVAVAGGAAWLVAPGLAVAGVALGFLVWNWHPARIFLGDSGSIPLGLALGGLLIELAASGQLAAALILPAYYVADASITLLWRLKDGEKIWQAHRRHFYQRAVRGGKSHSRVATFILAGNLLLTACAVAAVLLASPMIWAAAAAAVTAGMLAVLSAWAGSAVRR